VSLAARSYYRSAIIELRGHHDILRLKAIPQSKIAGTQPQAAPGEVEAAETNDMEAAKRPCHPFFRQSQLSR
jgi:hypothetical protein